jgi:peptide/nickel transport system substrate-binding protein
MMVAPHAWATLGPDEFAQTPAATGAYMIQDWGEDAGRSILVANTTSWRAAVHYDRLEIRFPLRDSVIRRQAMESGEIDVTVQVSFDDLNDLAALGFETYVLEVPQIRALALPNTRDDLPALKDVRVRQALNYAVDKNAIAETFYFNAVAPVG